MAAKHGTASRYVQGCRCDACTDAERVYVAGYRARRRGEQAPRPSVAGPVEQAVTAEI